MDLSLTNVNTTLRHRHRHHHSLTPPLHHHHTRPSFRKLVSFPMTSSFSSLTPIRASSSNPNSKTPKPQIQHKTLNPTITPISFLKTTFVTGVAVTVLFFSRFNLKPTIAAPISSPPPSISVRTFDDDVEEKAKALEQKLSSDPEDIDALQSLLELMVSNRRIPEAIGLLDRLINLDPKDSEWRLLKSSLQSYGGDHESARLGFEEVLSKEPLRVDAYHGLVMAVSAKESQESQEELKEIERRIVEGMDKCKKQKKKDAVRDFKLLLAQIRVIRQDFDEALMIYQQLCKDEPRDFRPYLCLGIVYKLLGKEDDAMKNFEKYRRLVPRGHPYATFFDQNLGANLGSMQKAAA